MRVVLWTVGLALAVALAAGAVYALAEPRLSLHGERLLESGGETADDQRTSAQRSSAGGSQGSENEEPEDPSPEERGRSPEAAAYAELAPEMPGIDQDSVEGVYKSRTNPDWASVHFEADEKRGNYVVFTRKTSGPGEPWEARRSIRADEPDSPRNEMPVLREVPRDLVDNRYAEAPYGESGSLPSEDVEKEELPEIEWSAPGEVLRRGDAPEDSELEDLEEEIGSYDGVAGVYVRDVEGEWGYGVRPGESFFSASVIKIPIMAAVFRKVESGELALDESHETKEEDWAAGAGTLQYDEPGDSYTIEEYLQKMMSESDNVATNALIRLVGGPEYVNSVASDLGAKDT
ncbi:MAG: class A beta-lactamase-related serine hydrolase, partial [Rubrobacter sp.]|nr:class A beta-lactamase-related serine hydrolase [Rubrobacter sp.]